MVENLTSKFLKVIDSTPLQIMAAAPFEQQKKRDSPSAGVVTQFFVENILDFREGDDGVHYVLKSAGCDNTKNNIWETTTNSNGKLITNFESPVTVIDGDNNKENDAEKVNKDAEKASQGAEKEIDEDVVNESNTSSSNSIVIESSQASMGDKVESSLQIITAAPYDQQKKRNSMSAGVVTKFVKENILDLPEEVDGVHRLVKSAGCVNPTDNIREPNVELSTVNQTQVIVIYGDNKKEKDAEKVNKDAEKESQDAEKEIDEDVVNEDNTSNSSSIIIESSVGDKLKSSGKSERPIRQSSLNKPKKIHAKKKTMVTAKSNVKSTKSRAINKKSKVEKSEAASSDAYEVEKIIGKRIVNGIDHYKIHWMGYDKRFDTWEPAENLNCLDLVQLYEKSINAKKKQSFPLKSQSVLKKKPSVAGSDSSSVKEFFEGLEEIINANDISCPPKSEFNSAGLALKRSRSSSKSFESSSFKRMRADQKSDIGQELNLVYISNEVENATLENLIEDDSMVRPTKILVVERAKQAGQSPVAHVLCSDGSEKYITTAKLTKQSPNVLVNYYEHYLNLH